MFPMYENCKLCGNNKFILLHKTSKYNYVKCSCCGVFSVNPLPKIPDQFYNDYEFNKTFIELFDEYKLLYKNSLIGKLRRIEGLLNKALKVKQMRFLDIGCGGGEYVYAAKELGLEAHGIDVDEKSCIFAKSLGLNIKNTDLINANYPENFFDVIQAKQVLEHIPEPKEFLLEVQRILKKDGVLMLDVPNQEGLIQKLKIILNLKSEEYGFLQPMRHIFAYNKESLNFILKKIGLKIIFCQTSWPGDPVDYPLYKQKVIQKIMFKFAASINMGSVLVVYAQKK